MEKVKADGSISHTDQAMVCGLPRDGRHAHKGGKAFTDKEDKSFSGGRSLDAVLLHAMDEGGCEVDVEDGADVGDVEEDADDEQRCAGEF